MLTNSNRRITAAHKRALDMLPDDGSWVLLEERSARTLRRLVCDHGDLAEEGFEPIRAQGSRLSQYRLTEQGRAFKAYIRENA